MEYIEGICGSPGKAAGTAVVVANIVPLVEPRALAPGGCAAEEQRFREVQKNYAAQLMALYEKTAAENKEAEAEIFRAYRNILIDEGFFSKVIKRMWNDLVGIEFAVREECEVVAALFEGQDDPYLKERMNDIRNVCDEVIAQLMGISFDLNMAIADVKDAILVAIDLTPTDTIQLDKHCLRGFVIERGCPTSHVAILAKVLGIPAVVGATGATRRVEPGEPVLLDATRGQVIVRPNEVARTAFEQELAEEQRLERLYLEGRSKPALTADGSLVAVNVNTGDVESIATFDVDHCDGVGLYRSEFLYMGQTDWPDEAFQFTAYKKMAELARGKEVIIRTLDIGGDKQLGYMGLPHEDNPFLGYRAIRICLDKKDIFRIQLRAILRASAFGDVKIMFPMIATVQELREGRALVKEAMASLDTDGLPYNSEIEIGIMIETPAAVMLSDLLAKEVDFFSVGSNDLIQYTMAADRMNEKVQYLYDNCSPPVLRSISAVAQNAAAAGIPWGICGEVASDELLVPLWVALGVTELSVAPSLVAKTKHLVRQCNQVELYAKVDGWLGLATADEVRMELEELSQTLLGGPV